MAALQVQSTLILQYEFHHCSTWVFKILRIRLHCYRSKSGSWWQSVSEVRWMVYATDHNARELSVTYQSEGPAAPADERSAGSPCRHLWFTLQRIWFHVNAVNLCQTGNTFSSFTLMADASLPVQVLICPDFEFHGKIFGFYNDYYYYLE